MLITYADSLGNNLKDLNTVLKRWYKDCIGGIHILPFFPSSGDRGFAPLRYDKVDPQFGDWSDIENLGSQYFLMFDFMVNHISRKSPYFQDYLQNNEASEWKDLFLTVKKAWGGTNPSDSEIDKIYKRKDKAPFEEILFEDGSTEQLWCTFSEEQLDLDVNSEVTQRFFTTTLKDLIKHGAKIIRLDAFAYCIKKKGTDCFFVKPDIWNLLHKIEAEVAKQHVLILPEIHEHYSIQLDIAKEDFWVYDFALPMLVLHTIYTSNGDKLKKWLKICPSKQFTTLDTHDGIGVVDVKDLLTEEEVEHTMETLYSEGANVKRKYSSAEYNNLDIYQINCTYYSALGNDDQKYLLARAIQFFSPGIPQVYYVGLLAGENDLELLEKTKQGRDINRHYYNIKEIEESQNRSVIITLNELMKFRNRSEAFDGKCDIIDSKDDKLIIRREKGSSYAQLNADLMNYHFTITHNVNGEEEVLSY